jgi:hypothetical protein
MLCHGAAAVKPKAYQALLLIEFGFFDSSNQQKTSTFLTMSRKAEKVLGRNDRAFRLIGLRFVVLQLPFCMVSRAGVNRLSNLALTHF